MRITEVTIYPNSKTNLDFHQKQGFLDLKLNKRCFAPPLISHDDFTQGRTFNANEIKRMAW